MVATAIAKLLQVEERKGKDKTDGREFAYYVNTLMTDEGVIVFTSGNNYSPLSDSAVLMSIKIEGLEKVKETKLIKLERVAEAASDIS